jgi:hypothetical protein
LSEFLVPEPSTFFESYGNGSSSIFESPGIGQSEVFNETKISEVSIHVTRFVFSGKIFGESKDFLYSRACEGSSVFSESSIVVSDCFGDSQSSEGSLIEDISESVSVVGVTTTAVDVLQKQNSSLSTGWIVGIVIGALFLVCLIGIGTYAGLRNGSQETEYDSIESDGPASTMTVDPLDVWNDAFGMKLELQALSGETE